MILSMDYIFVRKFTVKRLDDVCIFIFGKNKTVTYHCYRSKRVNNYLIAV